MPCRAIFQRGGSPCWKNCLAKNRVVGLKQTRRLLAAGHAGRVFLAKDADPALVEPLLAACRAVGVPAVTEFTMSQLGRAAGIAVGTAAAAVPSR